MLFSIGLIWRVIFLLVFFFYNLLKVFVSNGVIRFLLRNPIVDARRLSPVRGRRKATPPPPPPQGLPLVARVKGAAVAVAGLKTRRRLSSVAKIGKGIRIILVRWRIAVVMPHLVRIHPVTCSSAMPRQRIRGQLMISL